MPYFGKTPAETALQTDDLESNIVTTAKLADDSVTGAKLNIPLVAGDVIYASATDTMAKLAKGTAAQVLTMNAGATAPEWAATVVGGGLQSVQVFTASGTWTRPDDITHVDIMILGGGGGGGGVSTSGSNMAGGGGAEAEEAHLFLDVTAEAHATVAVTIGAGGTVGASSGGHGGTGGTTTFEVSGGTDLTAIGGGGGRGTVNTDPIDGSIGGTGGTGADYAFRGAVGHHYAHNGGPSGGEGGGRGGGRSLVGSGNGVAGGANSGGGGSGAATTNTTGYIGGLGGSGICIVKEYIK